MKRRQLLLAGGAGALGGLLAACGGGEPADVQTLADGREGALAVGAASAARVVIVGGGMAGGTLAKYLRLWSNGTIDVTLVERDARYTSCILSSLVLTGQRTLGSLRFTYDALRTKYGVKVVTGEVVEVDAAAARVRLADGTSLQGDRLVLATGIDFDPVPGLSNPNRMPHAWKAGAQTTLLASQLAAMPSGGTVVMTIPKVPYRCPPGPYERACLLADWLKARKPGSKLLVLDANPDFVTEKDNFSRAFFDLHGGVIEYRTNAEVLSADAASMTVTTSQGKVHGDVINLIPRQRAPAIIAGAGLANATEGRFAAVDVLSYASTAAPLVHVIGDSSATLQPKAGHIANQEAKVCADALLRIFAGEDPDPAPVTNSACFSTITMTKASWLEAVFQYDPAARTMVAVPAASGASDGWNGDYFEDMGKWFRALMADSLG
ncbi:MAG: FAD-dependent oxidoreductase [Burkholderiales bacterium]|nr:FAD-dependent oxidoreductase [Burkholderiales bacterium]